MTEVPGPLSGLRVLAIEHMIALPFATQLFARLGAEVIKIEPIGTGDRRPCVAATGAGRVGRDGGAHLRAG